MMEAKTLLDDRTFDTSIPRVRDDALVRHFANEAVAWSPLAPTPLHLDPVAALVLQLLDGTASIAELIEDVHEVLGIPRGVARGQLRRAVSLLDGGGMLMTSQNQDFPPANLDLFPAPPNP